MAWSDNLRCLHCDGKLPLYRKITSGQFCSAVHRKAYWQNQERLAVERLHETHDSLRAYRPPDALEAILGKTASDPVGSDRYYQEDAIPEATPEPEIDPAAEKMARSAANTGSVGFAGYLTEDKPSLRAWEALQTAWDVEFAHWPLSAPSLPETDRHQYEFEAAERVEVPLFDALGVAARIRGNAEKSGPLAFDTKPTAKVSLAAAIETEELSLAFLERLQAAEIAAEEPLPPAVGSLLALAKIGVQAASFAVHTNGPQPLETASRAENTSLNTNFAIPGAAALTELQPLAMTNVPRARAAYAGMAGDAEPLDMQASTPRTDVAIPAAGAELCLAPGRRYAIFGSAGESDGKANRDSMHSAVALEWPGARTAPSKSLATQRATRSIASSWNTAPGCRYGIQVRSGNEHPLGGGRRSDAARELPIVSAPQANLATQSLEFSLNTAAYCKLAVASRPGSIQPLRNLEACELRCPLQIVPLPKGAGRGERKFAATNILPLKFKQAACAPSAPVPKTAGLANIFASNEPMKLAAKWEPLEGADAPPPPQGFFGLTQSLANAEDRKHIWAHAVDFWQHAPRDLKLLAVAIPILLGLALRPSLPKVRMATPASTNGVARNIGNGFREQFVNVRNSVAERAAVSLSEDFRSGLDDWQSRGDLASGWSFDGNGFVRPGTLALYRPSLGLTDYEMEFLGLIDKKAMSWVVRARDFDNYYVVKLVVMKAGPLPTMGITRYAVIDGKAQGRVDTIARINARPDMLYRVGMNVHEDTFLLTLQGTVVDNWTEPRLTRGGVGFFAPSGEQSRLRWVQLTHQYDMLGRLCAYLAPYNNPTTNGSW